MNENESKKSVLVPVVGMIALILALFIGIKVIFLQIDKRMPELPKNPYEVIDVTSGTPSDWKLEIVAAETDSPAYNWLKQCQEETGLHTLRVVEADSCEIYLYLPGVTEELQNTNVAMEVEEKDDASAWLNVYVTTAGAQGKKDPKTQLLHFTPPEGKTWPNTETVTLDGAPVPVTSRCILNNGVEFWARDGEAGTTAPEN